MMIRGTVLGKWSGSGLLTSLLLAACAAEGVASETFYGGKIGLGQPLSTRLAPAVADLQLHLKQMNGVNYVVSQSPVAPAIYLYLTSSALAQPHADVVTALSSKGPEAFVIRGNATKLYIFSNNERGLAHGIYYYLEQLGVRWLLPGANWAHVPSRPDVTLTISRLVEPAFHLNRSFAGTGGFYGVGFGRLYAGSDPFKADALAWNRRLRYSYEYSLGKAMGEAFVMEHAKPYPDPDPNKPRNHTLQEHPEYLATIDGKPSPLYIPARSPGKGQYVLDSGVNRYTLASPAGTGTHDLNIIAKVNAGNPAAVNLFCNWVLTGYRRTRSAPGGDAYKTVSVEPADGSGYGNNYAELRAAGVGKGTGSDQSYFIANRCARMVRAEYPDASVVILAYAGHVDPPSFRLEPNVIIQVTPGAFRSGGETGRLTYDEFISLWGTVVKAMAIYLYESIPDWAQDQPSFHYLDQARHLRSLYGHGVRGVHAESTYSAGAMGLAHYISSRLLWNPSLKEQALADEWYETAFGPAKEPMKRVLERWSYKYRPISAELSASYSDLREAESLAAGNPVILARVRDFAGYLHYLRLRVEFNNAATTADKNTKANEIATHIFSINESRMVQTTRIFDLLAYRGYPDLKAEFHIHNPTVADSPANGPGWSRVHPLSGSELSALISDGMRAYPSQDFTLKYYLGSLTRLTPGIYQDPAGDPWGPAMATAAFPSVELEIPVGLDAFPLRISRMTNNSVTIRNSAGDTVFRREIKAATDVSAAEALATWEEMSIPLARGRYTIAFYSQGGRTGKFYFQTWKGVPITLRDFLVPKAMKRPPLYYYVPRGEGKVVIYFPDGLGQFAKIFDSQRRIIAMELRDNNKVGVAAVPPGEDGKIWSVTGMMSPNFSPEMLTTPQTFSLEPGTLLVPADSR